MIIPLWVVILVAIVFVLYILTPITWWATERWIAFFCDLQKELRE
jgi:hypothetical protein